MADDPVDVGFGPANWADIIDRDACMGSGNCLHWAPEVFALDEDGIALVHGDPTAFEEQVRQAAINCPTRAIRIEGLFRNDQHSEGERVDR